MDEYFVDSSQCSSPGHQGISPKRQRLDTSKTLSLSTPVIGPVLGVDVEQRKMRLMEKEIISLRIKLSQIEATLKIRKQKEQLAAQENDILEMRVQSETETKNHLQEQLESTIKSINEAGEAQAATESELSQVKISMTQKVKELMIENALLRAKTHHSTSGMPPTSLQSLGDKTEFQGKLKVAEERIIDLEKQLEGNSTVQSEFDRQKMEHSTALASMTTRVKQLEEELRGAKDIITTLCEDDEGVQPVDKQQLQNVEKTPDVTQITVKVDPDWLLCQRGSPGPVGIEGESDCNSSSDSTDEEMSSSSKKDPDEDESPLPTASEKSKDLRSIKGNYYSFRPTNPKYFELNWDKECKRKGRLWKCRKCPQTYVEKRRMEDHVWIKHYGEKFECAHCTYCCLHRSDITNHVKKFHPRLFVKRKSRRQFN